MSVFVSAGHSGTDPGAAAPGYSEATETVRVRNAVAAKLAALGVSAGSDGSGNTNQSLTSAAAAARKADIAVEFHFNSSSNKTASGVEVLAQPKDRALAQSLASAVSSALGLPLRGDGGYKTESSGAHTTLAFVQAGGLIVEVCFISNPNDMRAYNANFDAMTGAVANVLAGTQGISAGAAGSGVTAGVVIIAALCLFLWFDE